MMTFLNVNHGAPAVGIENPSGRSSVAPTASAANMAAAPAPSAQVTLSTAAQALQAQGRVDITTLPAWVQQQSRSLHENPDAEYVDQLVRDIALIPDGELVALAPDSDGIRGVTYTATGLPVTEDSKAYFKAMSQQVLAGRSALYESELARGTPPADIFDKLQVYMSQQAPQYLGMMNWYGLAASKPAALG